MDKFVQREPKRARANDSIANSTSFISVPVEVAVVIVVIAVCIQYFLILFFYRVE